MPTARTINRGRTDGTDRLHLVAFDRAELVALVEAIRLKANRKPLLDNRRTLLHSAAKAMDVELGCQPGPRVAVTLSYLCWDRVKVECRSIGQHEAADLISATLRAEGD